MWGHLSGPSVGSEMQSRTRVNGLVKVFRAQMYTILLEFPLSVSNFVRIFVKIITH